MALDRISETIAHFAGFFELMENGVRLRPDSDGFNWQDNGFGPHKPLTVTPHGPTDEFDLAGYIPGLTPFWFFYQNPELFSLSMTSGLADLIHKADDPENMLDAGENAIPTASAFPGFGGYELPTAPSHFQVTFQMNHLSDNDMLGVTDVNDFISASVFAETMQVLVTYAGEISVVHPETFAAVMDDAADVHTQIMSGAGSGGTDTGGNATVSHIVGVETSGVMIDGVAADSMPDMSDILPVYHQADDNEDLVNLFEAEDGHSTVTGGNFVINETVISQQAPDAGLIIVAGDVISLTSISQTNVLQNIDQGIETEDASDLLINASEITLNSSLEDGSASGQVTMPSNWNVTRIEGDLISANWVEQQNFITDHDTATITWSAEDSYISLGENTGLNQVLSLDFTMHYDLIIIGGQMVDFNLIRQTNILLDDDTLSWDADHSFGAGGADNLLANFAQVNSTGTDSYQTLNSEYSDLIDGLADGYDGFPVGVDLSAAGGGTLNVLYISGDYFNVNMIDQINTLGDADQVDVVFDAMSERAAETDGDITFTHGSNALVNIATILDSGLDSTVMAGGQIYDDATLYQAGMVTEAGEDGMPPALATEAVAFLMEDATALPEDVSHVHPEAYSEAPADIMQCMTA